MKVFFGVIGNKIGLALTGYIRACLETYLFAGQQTSTIVCFNVSFTRDVFFLSIFLLKKHNTLLKVIHRLAVVRAFLQTLLYSLSK